MANKTPSHPKNTMSNVPEINIRYLARFSLKPKDLNFNDKTLKKTICKMLKPIAKRKYAGGPRKIKLSDLYQKTIESAAIKIALAGIGTPLKFSF